MIQRLVSQTEPSLCWGWGGRQTFSSWEHGERRPGLERQCVNVPRDRYVRLQQRGGGGGGTGRPGGDSLLIPTPPCDQAADVAANRPRLLRHLGKIKQHVES